jgi:hypothetical protein
MKLKKNAFIMTVAMILGLFVLSNVTLWHKAGSFTYLENEFYLVIFSIFLWMIIIILPRTVEIMLGSESQAPGNGIDEIHDSEMSDSDYSSQH